MNFGCQTEVFQLPHHRQYFYASGKQINTFMQMEKHDFRTVFRSKIRIENDIVFCDYNDENLQQISANDIVIIGIHTNWNGSNFNYCYIDFVTNDNQWQIFPLYADNADKLIDYIQEQFQVGLKDMLLISSNEWNSIVVYPEYLQAKPFFKFTPTENYKEPKSFFDKVLSKAGLGNFNTVKSIDLTDEVRAEMNNASR